MIIPVSPDKLAKMTDDEVVAAYEELGFAHDVAVAYVAVLRGGRLAKATTVLPDHAFLSTEAARELAEAAGHRELLVEVEKSEAASVGFMNLSFTEGSDLVVSAPTVVMVALMLDRTYPSLKVAGGVTDPHITLCHLGETDDLTLEQTRTLIAVTAEVAARHARLRGVVKGTGYFEEEGAWFAVPHLPGLDSLRADLADSLKAAGLPVSEKYDFTPHVTLAYTAERPNVDVAPFEVYVEHMTAVVGSYRYDSGLAEEVPSLAPPSYEPLVPYDEQKVTPFVPIVKSNDEKRFTLAPMYVPNAVDAHGDWSEPEDLQDMVWKFSRGDRMIALQHMPEAGPMGEAVEMMVMPWEHTVPMFKADGTSYEHTFPAGTPWLGVVWNEDVWPLVKSGKVRGYSIGGRASLLDVDMPEAVTKYRGE